MATGEKKCSKCGASIPANAPAEHCPACLMGNAIGGGEDSLGSIDGGETTSLQSAPVRESVGDTIANFTLLEKLGEGGFGVVWAAEQKQPVKRRVALKIIKLGMDTKQVVARFEAERQALALMDHPNIAKVLDAGATDSGRPYFVMELVKGMPITKYFEQEGTRITERLQIFIRVCQAIQHAHQKGIIHRDIKPSNIMVTLHDGVPVPKVIDFGIAKATQGELTDKTIYTQYSQFIGTPAYMSPEQAEMSGLDIDTRTDVYSLGVLLYEILTGTTPFDSHELSRSGVDAMRKIIREREPEKPSTRMSQTVLQGEARPSRVVTAETVSRVRGDLDWIVMKCLEKDRTRRYETATGLAQDVERHLNDEPVSAVAPSLGYQFQKLYLRHQGVLRFAAVVGVLMVLALVFSSWQAYEASVARDGERVAKEEAVKASESEAELRVAAESERDLADAAKESLRQELYVSDLLRAKDLYQEGNVALLKKMLAKHYPSDGESDLRGVEWYYWWQLAYHGIDYAYRSVSDLAVSPDQRWIAFAVRDKAWNWVVHVFNPLSGEFITEIPILDAWEDGEIKGTTYPMCFSADGRFLAIAGFGRKVRLWDTETWSPTETVFDAAAPEEPDAYGGIFFLGSRTIAFSKGNRYLLSAYSKTELIGFLHETSGMTILQEVEVCLR